jgi:mannosyl-3-phosphoglycerate phosphatase
MGTVSPFLIIFTDLDGTLLDHDTYEWKAARPALERCKATGIPVILVSSKTRDEMQRIRAAMANSDPFISENGGGIFFPDGVPYDVPNGIVFATGMWQWSLGQPYAFLVQSLHEIRQKLGWDIRGFSDMTVEEISQITGLDLETSRLASKRDYDEPFLLPEDGLKYPLESLRALASRRGLRISVGGRFLHLHGQYDKGDAVSRLISWYNTNHDSLKTAALGDSPNDYPMLRRVDVPILVRSAEPFQEYRVPLPNLRTTRDKGPEGWNRAVLDLLVELDMTG